jgi:hypothetical protein
MLRAVGIAGLALAVGIVAAVAQNGAGERPDMNERPEMKGPRLAPTHVDWDAAAADLGAIEALNPAPPAEPTEATRPAAVADLFARLNRATGERFRNIAGSPVPVLLPFDTAAFLRDRAAAAPEPAGETTTTLIGPPSPPPNHLSGFNSAPFFLPGPDGYDAVVVARAQEMRELGIGYAEPIYIQIGGAALLYELDEPAGMIGWPVNGLDDIPGVRRLYLESSVRYTFVRFGVPYVVAVECFDGGARFRKISCRDADKVAVRFLKSLHVVGGTPQPQQRSIANTIDRPASESAVFTYHGRRVDGRRQLSTERVSITL